MPSRCRCELHGTTCKWSVTRANWVWLASGWHNMGNLGLNCKWSTLCELCGCCSKRCWCNVANKWSMWQKIGWLGVAYKWLTSCELLGLVKEGACMARPSIGMCGNREAKWAWLASGRISMNGLGMTIGGAAAMWPTSVSLKVERLFGQGLQVANLIRFFLVKKLKWPT